MTAKECVSMRRSLFSDSKKQYDALFICFLFFISLAWFFPMLQKGFIMGDDLALPAYAKGMTLKEVFMPADATKYRPFLSLFLLLVSKITTGTYYEYFFINLVIHWINSVVLYRICYSISQNKLRAFLISCLFITSQFSYYNVLQGLGMMEGLALLFVLIGLYFGVRYCKENKISNFLYVVLFSFLACFTHERYITLSIVCVFLALLSFDLNWKKRIIRAAIGLIPMISNWFIKSVLFRSDFMSGTDGRSIALDIGSVIGFFFQGMLNIFGINIGPDYLNGYTFTQYTVPQKIMAIMVTGLFVTGTLYTLVKAIRAREDKCRKLRFFLMFCILAGGTLIGGCVTIRLEMRWVLAPFAVFLAFLAFASIMISNQKIATAGIALIALLYIPINYVYSQNLNSVFFVRSMTIAKQTYQGMIQKYGDSLADSEVYIISNDEMDWAVGMQPWQPSSLFDIYLEKPVALHSIRSKDEIDTDSKKVKVFQLNPDLTVSEVFYIPPHETIIDLNNTESIHSNPDTPADTPTGEGVLIYNDALTVLSGYSASSEKAEIPTGTELLLSAYIPFADSDGAYVSIYLQNEEDKDAIYQTLVFPDQPVLHELIPIDSYMDQAELCVEVTSPSGDASLDWVVLDECSLILEGAK